MISESRAEEAFARVSEEEYREPGTDMAARETGV